MKEGREGGMKCTLFFLYLGFNLLNISKTAAPDSSVRGSRFVPSTLQSNAHCTSSEISETTDTTSTGAHKVKGETYGTFKDTSCVITFKIKAVTIYFLSGRTYV